MNQTPEDDVQDAVEQEALSPLQRMILQILRIVAWGSVGVALMHIINTP
ncbi:MAG TPA: hypothetical protein VN462_09545 [Negativicutes bacterium]|nr:hypothetical protein [Negativicutes bacterium]